MQPKPILSYTVVSPRPDLTHMSLAYAWSNTQEQCWNLNQPQPLISCQSPTWPSSSYLENLILVVHQSRYICPATKSIHPTWVDPGTDELVLLSIQTHTSSSYFDTQPILMCYYTKFGLKSLTGKTNHWPS